MKSRPAHNNQTLNDSDWDKFQKDIEDAFEKVPEGMTTEDGDGMDEDDDD